MVATAGCAPLPGTDIDRSQVGAGRDTRARSLALEEDEVYVVNAFAQQLVAYDTRRHLATRMTNEPDHFYYGFRTSSDLYTVGHSIENRFEIREITSRGMRTIVALPERYAIFPLTTDAIGSLFVRYTFAGDGREIRREIVELVAGGALAAWTHVDAAVSYGAVVGPWLYFTVWEESSADYSLHRVRRDDRSDAPRRVRDGLTGGELHAHQGALFTSDGHRLSNGATEVACQDLCWFRDDPNILVTLTVAESASLRLDVYDGRDFSLLRSVAGAVGFDISGHEVHVYGDGFEERIDVSSRS